MKITAVIDGLKEKFENLNPFTDFNAPGIMKNIDMVEIGLTPEEATVVVDIVTAMGPGAALIMPDAEEVLSLLRAAIQAAADPDETFIVAVGKVMINVSEGEISIEWKPV